MSGSQPDSEEKLGSPSGSQASPKSENPETASGLVSGSISSSDSGNTEIASGLVTSSQPGTSLPADPTPTMPPKKSKPEEKPAVAIDEGSPALAKFLSNPQAYVSYISPQLLSDGSNISQWLDSLEDLALLVFGIRKFCLEESNFMLLSATMDRSLTHVIKNSISVDLRPILRDSESSWDSLETLKKNFHKSVQSRQFDLLSSLVKLDSAPTPAHFNKFFSIVSELGGLGLHIPLELQGLFLQVLTQPPTGTTRTTLNNLILAASEKTDQLGPRDVQVMYNSLITESVDGDGSLNSPFQINQLSAGRWAPEGSNGSRNTGQSGSGRRPPFGNDGIGGHQALALDQCGYCRERGHWKRDCPTRPENRGRTSGGPGLQKNPVGSYAPAIRVAAADAQGIVDTGATNHVSGSFHLLTNVRPLKQSILLNLASFNGSVTATHVGTLSLPSKHSTISLENVLYSPAVRGTLISLGQLVDEGFQVELKNDSLVISDLVSGEMVEGSFGGCAWNIALKSSHPLFSSSTSPTPAVMKLSGDWGSSLEWHCRLGHVSDKIIKSFLKRYVPSFDLRSWVPFFCETCAATKSERRRAELSSEISSKDKLDLVVSDVLGPVNPPDIFGNEYVLTLRDHATTFSYCFVIKSRSEVETKLQHALKIISVQQKPPKHFRCDNAKEYTKKSFVTFLNSLGTTMALKAAYTPEQNGEAERLNRTLGDMARSMLKHSGLPKTMWTFAYKAAVFLHNRLPNSRTKDKTPLELWAGVTPQVENMYLFGAKAYVHIPKENRIKMDDRGRLCFLVGYLEDGRGWYFWDAESKSVISSSAATFVEYAGRPLIPKNTNKASVDFMLNQLELPLGKVPVEIICKEQDTMLEQIPQISDLEIPKNLKNAKKSELWDWWKKACVEELKSLEEFDVWDVLDEDPKMKVAGSRWVFALKRNSDNLILRFKARFVVQGFTQVLGVDCFATFAPTASLSSLRVLFALAEINGWEINTFDVSTAYLHSPIDEEIYVRPPVELCPELKGKVLKLKKALYGTKQAPRCWWKFFKSVMEKLGFVVEEVEQSIYRCKRNDDLLLVWMHVDDGVVFTNSSLLRDEIKEGMEKDLKIKWEFGISRVVGIDVERKDGIRLSQSHLAKQIVDEAEKYLRKSILAVTTPLPDENLFTCFTNEPVDVTQYQHFIGCLNYLALGTRPDISYAVNYLARYSQNPQKSHWRALTHLIGYIKRTGNDKLVIAPRGNELQLWVDAGWGGEFSRSTSGFLVQLGGAVVAWGSRRQKTVAMSTCAAEYISMGSGIEFLIFLKSLIENCWKKIGGSIYCDNKTAILVMEDNASRGRLKHLDRQFFYSNEMIRKHDLQLSWVKTTEQLADVFTKRLGPVNQTKARRCFFSS
ncbi:hypothetical protein MJO28_001798 [Puccinia striiformis f. sp. tritici]|uniref:Uncharacterized protein n=1 Tax=Puccinia striiformis f. sp. tritici TaxID=168172 RepID=A0ACC0EX04_9BASI|nr:hypothetical protein MJO28_001798 [Puccinia striiformis f. sp. tritici]